MITPIDAGVGDIDLSILAPDPAVAAAAGAAVDAALPEPTLHQFFAAWDLFKDPVLCGAVAGALLGFLGVYIVLKRMVFVSAAITQSAGLGVALAFYGGAHLGLHVDPVVVAALMAVLASLLFLIDPTRLGLSRESVLGMTFALASALAIVVGSRVPQEAHDIQAILFGTAVMVRPGDVTAVELSALLLGGVHLWWYRGITFVTFDPIGARVQGLPTRLLGGTVVLSIGLMVGVSARALGALPVFAFSTLPAMAALSLGFRLSVTFALAALFGVVSAAGGYVLSFLEDFPVGGAQTLVAGAIALGAFVVRTAMRLAARR